jgi:hypothetical protein
MGPVFPDNNPTQIKMALTTHAVRAVGFTGLTMSYKVLKGFC